MSVCVIWGDLKIAMMQTPNAPKDIECPYDDEGDDVERKYAAVKIQETIQGRQTGPAIAEPIYFFSSASFSTAMMAARFSRTR